ncbi:YcaO-like family protein [Candidatus Saccharibacteria bacterium]|nr:YcaO-like family protein [Candidatus Saccharibacteria bacterium]
MNINFAPILVVPAVPYKGGIRFLHRENQIDIGHDMADEVWKILSLCNGYTKVSSIIESSGLPKDDVMEILVELEDMELIVDSRRQFMHFHRISNYPSSVNSDLTQDEVEAYTKSERLPVRPGEVVQFDCDTSSALFWIRENRRSCRSFSEKKMTIDQIGSICHFAYSIPDHSVPSGGALYPLRIYVLIERPQDGLEPGYYEYDAEQNHLVCFNDEVDVEQLKYCFNQEEMPFGSSVQIVIAADLERQSYKYANRGYRLTLIEVGHVAENISLYCAEQGIGSCEMGGVQDEPLKQELELSDSIWPILAIPVGYPLDSETEQFNKIRFVEEHVGASHPVKEVWTRVFNGDGSFFGATTTYLDENGNIQYAGATSPSYADAVFKATIEGYERYQSSQVRADFRGSANQVPGKWLDPRVYFPLTEEQAKKCGVKFFTKDLVINWTLGTNYDGSEIYIPSDLVYYGQKDDENRIYYGNSSGIAAHFDFDEAKRRAVVELIERDALMRNWFSQESPRRIDEKILPIHIRKRITHWIRQNRQLIVLQVPSDFGMVFETAIVGNEYPYFVSGAAATVDKDSVGSTILKSVQEAEYNLMLALRYPDMVPIDPSSVSTPADHGKVYYFKENADKLHWLWKNVISEGCIQESMVVENLNWLCNEHLQLITVDLSDKKSDIRIVRAFSPWLVPINFGFNSAHYTHPVIQHSASVDPDSLRMPHYFA